LVRKWGSYTLSWSLLNEVWVIPHFPNSNRRIATYALASAKNLKEDRKYQGIFYKFMVLDIQFQVENPQNLEKSFLNTFSFNSPLTLRIFTRFFHLRLTKWQNPEEPSKGYFVGTLWLGQIDAIFGNDSYFLIFACIFFLLQSPETNNWNSLVWGNMVGLAWYLLFALSLLFRIQLQMKE